MTGQCPLFSIPALICIGDGLNAIKFSNVVFWGRMLARAFNEKPLVPGVWTQSRIINARATCSASSSKRLDRFIDFGFVRERLRDTYSAIGRPSIDPEVLLRLLLVGYLYGITSERRLIEEVRMHLAYRWFSRLGFEREIPDHSTFSKNGMADSAV